MIVIGSNTSDNGKSRFTEDVSHFMELRQNRQLALLKRSAKNERFVTIAAYSGIFKQCHIQCNKQEIQELVAS